MPFTMRRLVHFLLNEAHSTPFARLMPVRSSADLTLLGHSSPSNPCPRSLEPADANIESVYFAKQATLPQMPAIQLESG